MRKILFSLLMLAAAPVLSAQTYCNLLPEPVSVAPGHGVFVMEDGLSICAPDGLEFEGGYLRERLESVFAFEIEVADVPYYNGIELRLIDGMDPESYRLEVGEDRVQILAPDAAGIFYGIQTLLQMMPAQVYGDGCMELTRFVLDAVTVDDAPRYGYRGAMLDVSRTFFDVEHVLRLIDWMAYHKLNRFHWHLADDNGWRIEIRRYPDLTRKGAWRGDDEVSPAAYGQGHGRYGGYYTQKDIRRVVKYAAERHIEIIPEIDLPGHSRSLVGVFPEMACDMDVPYITANGETDNVLCVARKENYIILDNIFREIAVLFPSEYIHIGGDEVDHTSWNNCPHCRAMMKEYGLEGPENLHSLFVYRMEDILHRHGRKMAGWDEIINTDARYDSTARVYAWRSVESGRAAVEKGYSTVVQIGEYCYLDMKQSPAERGHSWAGIVPLSKTYSLEPDEILVGSPADSALIVGVQAGLWAELMAWPPRLMEYQYFPRLCALAEVGWSSKTDRDFEDFEQRLYNKHFSRLYNMGIAFRVAPPEVAFDGQVLDVRVPHPSVVVRYTMDRTAPVASSPVCRGEIVTDRPEDFRFAAFFGESLSSISVGASNISLYDYLEPSTVVKANFPMSDKYLESLASRDGVGLSDRTLRAGDTLAYVFDSPVDCSRITFTSGAPSSGMFYVTDAYVEYVTDAGETLNAGVLYHGELTFRPEAPVREVRVVMTDSNDAYTAVFRGLMIEK
ncbi:MAG TPA: beta-N-acetylhexosaminidase [Candidatus Coprenecus pullistercoris]|nr:beta-N-acetylhexosaminidase [Candidatus Coprenecus pullistercoris]